MELKIVKKISPVEIFVINKIHCFFFKIINLFIFSGKIIRLEPEDMLPMSEYFIGKILEYKIVQHPTFGDLKAGKSKVNRFTFKQLETAQVHYVHDGSENSTDMIRFIAITRLKESVPFEMFITILPVNDEIPQILTNTGLQMWSGGRAAIKNTDLSKFTLSFW